MPRGILLDEVHLTFTCARRLPRDRQDAIVKALRSGRFSTFLKEAVARVVKRFAALRDARINLSR